MGDPTGIGPEVGLAALASELALSEAEGCDRRYLLFGEHPVVDRWARRYGVAWEVFKGYATTGRVAVWDPGIGRDVDETGWGSEAAARVAIECLAEGARRALGGELAALVTGPVNKEAILRTGLAFTGQTEFLGDLSGVQDVVMMLLGTDERDRWLRVALVTTHLPISAVASAVTAEKVERAILRSAQACRDLGLSSARVAVCGLNPHAGEGGHFGGEEITTIGPAVERMKARGIQVTGPWAADTVFHRALRGDFEAVVAMYHDQGLAPLKMVAFHSGVNWTLGLPFIRTSPDHGTAYDLAGRGVADGSSMRSAIRLAQVLAARRRG